MTQSTYPVTLTLAAIGPVMPPTFNGANTAVGVFIGTGALSGSITVIYSRHDGNGFYIFVIDKSGKYTWLTILMPNAPIPIAKQGIIPLGGGYFIVDYENYYGQATGSISFQAPNAKINNTSPIIIQPLAFSITNTCRGNAGADQVFYDPVNNLIAGEFIHPTGGNAGQIYNSIYKINGLSLTKIAEGYQGVYPPDTFNQTSANFPGSITANVGINSSNGYQTMNGNSSGYYVGGAVNKIHQGNNSGCVVQTGAYVSTALNRYDYVPSASWVPTVDTSLGNVIGAIAWSPVGIRLFDLFQNELTINTTNGASGATFAAVDSENLFVVNPSGTGNFQALYSQITLSPYFGPTEINQGFPIPLANFALPVRNILYPNNGSLS